MKKRFFLLLLLLLAIITAFAQTQQGYVKTKGRLASNGTIVHGVPLSGVTVAAKGRNAALSDNNGMFSLVIPGSSYYLQNVKKQGYVLTDPDVLSKQYVQSKNPLVLVLETPDEQLEDKLEAMTKIRSTLQNQLIQSRAEIKTLKEKNMFTQEEYRKKLQELAVIQESNEKLVNDMAERYSKIDYDQLDEFNAQISKYILNGELQKADSMLNTKGNIKDRTADLRQLQAQNVKEEVELSNRKKKLEKRKELAIKELEDIAQDCYSKFEIFKMKHQNDSAAYYIEYRANLDTTNVEWKLAAGLFVETYLGDYSRSIDYYKNALHFAETINDSCLMSSCYNNIGSSYVIQGNYENAWNYFLKSLDYLNEYQHGADAIETYNNIGVYFECQGKYDDALSYYKKSLSIPKERDDSTTMLSKLYNNVGEIYYLKANYEEALDCFEKAKAYSLSISGKYSPEVANSYNNLASTYKMLGDKAKSRYYNEEALTIRTTIFGELHPDVALTYNNMGYNYATENEYQKAIQCHEKALNIRRKVYGSSHPLIALSLNNLGGVYLMDDNLDMAMKLLTEALEIRKVFYGNIHPAVATSINNLGGVSLKKGDNEKALHYFFEALSVRKQIYGEAHPEIASSYGNIGDAYFSKEEYNEALKYYKMADEMFSCYFPQTNINVQTVKKKIEQCAQHK